MKEIDRTKAPGIQVAQIFLEQVEFSHREDYLDLPPTAPAFVGNVNLQVQTGMSPDATNGLVRVTVQTLAEHKPLYNFRVAMTALIVVDQAAPNMPLRTYLAGPGAAMLYPFVRQVVADLTWRGRFGPIWLSPVNVMAPAAVSPAPVQMPGKTPAKRVKARKRARRQ